MRRTGKLRVDARAWWPVVAGWALVSMGSTVRADDLKYNRDVRPLLAEACFQCHGPGVKKAGLRLDQRDFALKATATGATPIVPGKPAESEVVARIFSADKDEVMPPPSSRKTLTPAQKDILKRWVQEGAGYEKHWAFQTPVKPPTPKIEAAGYRIINPIDAFVAERLRREGLTMSPGSRPGNARASRRVRTDRLAADARRGRPLRRRYVNAGL